VVVVVSALSDDTDETAPVPLVRRGRRVVTLEDRQTRWTDGRRGFRRSTVNSAVAFRPDAWWC
jgi:hypothetical protein